VVVGGVIARCDDMGSRTHVFSARFVPCAASFPRRRESAVVRLWIPAYAGMTRLFPIAATLRVLLLDIRVTFAPP
jgi:hypothetical protein